MQPIDLPPDDETSQHIEDTASELAEMGVSRDLQMLLSRGLHGTRAPRALRTKRAASAFAQAFELIGGVPRLALWADRNPDKFYPLFARLIPQPAQSPNDAPITPDEMAWVSARRLMYQMGSRLAEDIDAKTPPAD